MHGTTQLKELRESRSTYDCATLSTEYHCGLSVSVVQGITIYFYIEEEVLFEL